VLYAGADLGCALGETVFHDLPDDPANPAEVFRSDFRELRASTIEVKRDTELVDLTDSALAQLGYRRDEVVDTPPSAYVTTRLWGQLAWEQDGPAGLVWDSRRSPGQLAFMLFVARGRARRNQLRRRAHVDAAGPPVALYDGPGLAAVLAEATKRNVTVVF